MFGNGTPFADAQLLDIHSIGCLDIDGAGGDADNAAVYQEVSQGVQLNQRVRKQNRFRPSDRGVTYKGPRHYDSDRPTHKRNVCWGADV
jgi:hypothetical protein